MRKNSGLDLWKKAVKIIPGGNQLFSKRSEKYLPDQWPTYFQRAKGCEVWDLDGNHYYDFAAMGVGSCTLGYAHPEINARVKESIDSSSMGTLNSPEEVELAEKLVGLHPWADMVRFSRTGGEACAIAIRIGRAATRKSKIAFCGYHGWHDWYLASNLADDSNLDNQLLPGLNVRGVPRELTNTIFPFNYNKLDELHAILAAHKNEIGVIIMEPMRDNYPQPGFLEGVRKAANEIGAVLIFDEVTSGFRMNCGGIHLTMGVEPDVAIFGKALGNGFPISAVIGRRAIMDVAQDTFISSTFWTERIGFVAGVATLEIMQREKAQEKMIAHGKTINEAWKSAAEANDIDIHISGVPPLTHVTFNYENSAAIQTLYCQEMLKRGYLLGAAIYTTSVYTKEILEKFAKDTKDVFGIIAGGIRSNKVEALLEGPIMHKTFKRLT